MNRAKTIYLFLARNCCVFDEHGEQIIEYQRAMSCYRINKKLAMQATEEAEEFFISSWKDWAHPISRKSMQYMLGLRTRKMDLAELGFSAAEVQQGAGQ